MYYLPFFPEKNFEKCSISVTLLDNKGNKSSIRYLKRKMMDSIKAKRRYTVEKVYFSERKKWFIENNRPFWIIPSFFSIITYLLFLLLYYLNIINMHDNSLSCIIALPAVLVANCMFFYSSYTRFHKLMEFSIGKFIYDIEINNDSIFIKYLDSDDFENKVSLPIADYSLILESYPKCLEIQTKGKKNMCVIIFKKSDIKNSEIDFFVNFFLQYNILGWKESVLRKIKSDYISVKNSIKRSRDNLS